MRRWISAIALWSVVATPAAAQSVSGDEWAAVDRLRPGTRIVVTLKTGERRKRVFAGTSTDDLRISKNRQSGGDETVAKTEIARVVIDDAVADGIWRGALVGAGGMLGIAGAHMKSCNEGCDWGSTTLIVAASAVLGSGAGAIVGVAADADARPVVLYPAETAAPAPRTGFSRPPVRLGLSYTATTPRTSSLRGRAMAPSFSGAVRLSPHISIHAEFVRLDTTFTAAPGAISDDVVSNIIPATTRVAGRSFGLESRRIPYIFTELVGFHAAPIGRLQIEILGGVSVQGQEERGYFDAYRVDAGGRTQSVPGKYHVLDFASPETALVIGLDADVAITGRFSVIPTIRYHAAGDSSAVTFGAGAHWRF